MSRHKCEKWRNNLTLSRHSQTFGDIHPKGVSSRNVTTISRHPLNTKQQLTMSRQTYWCHDIHSRGRQLHIRRAVSQHYNLCRDTNVKTIQQKCRDTHKLVATVIQNEYREGMSQQHHDTPEDQPTTHSVATNVLVSRHSFQRLAIVHQEDNVTKDLEETRLEEKVATIKIMSRHKL